MQQERLEFTEARFVLTIVICLSVAIGYIALHRLGGTGDAPLLEERPPAELATKSDKTHPPNEENQPQVLPIDPQSPHIHSPQAPDHPAVVRRNDDAPGTAPPNPSTRLQLR